eukprot:11279625-Alexandrium_andersonii.AAC.1
MSASLVGSEMCIRDRPFAEHGHRGEVANEVANNVVTKTPVGGMRLEAVSYTHLTLPTICSV